VGRDSEQKCAALATAVSSAILNRISFSIFDGGYNRYSVFACDSSHRGRVWVFGNRLAKKLHIHWLTKLGTSCLCVCLVQRVPTQMARTLTTVDVENTDP